MGYQRNSLLPPLFLLLASLFITSATAQPLCLDGDGNYTINSTFYNNLRTLLTNISRNVGETGFYNASVGETPNQVYTVVLCRADVQLDVCRGCIQTATLDVIQTCPNVTHDTNSYEFCMLRYTNYSMVGRLQTGSPQFLYNTRNSTRPEEFMSDLRILLDNISSQVSNGGTVRNVAYGSRPTVGFQTIYALEQCMPYLTVLECNACLTAAVTYLPSRFFYGSIGVSVYLPTCNLRYNINRFYNETRLQELLSLPMPMPPLASPPGPGRENGNNTTRTIIIVVSTVTLVIVILIGILIWRRKHKKKKEKTVVEEVDDISVIESLQYDFSIIQVATDNFSEANKLGQGGFGAVYKGKLPNGQEIAAKRLSIGSGQGDLEFKNEVMILERLQHRNLVRLHGFSLEGQEKLLIYEFVQNASLDQFLFDPSRCSQLDWNRRYKIIGGIARGVLYLHEDSRVRIIHRDLKASNVLLDEDMSPKIADFGMARLFVPDETQGNTSRIVGTYGYMAPEYASRGQFSIKSDIFSFGVILLEIISGLKNNCSRNGEIGEDLISSAWGNWRNGSTANLVDPVLRVGSNIPRDILRCIHIGLLCVQESAAQRPTMATIVVMLNSSSITLPLPSPPAFLVHSGYNSESSVLQEFNSRGGSLNRPENTGGGESEDSMSQNEMSISEFVAR